MEITIFDGKVTGAHFAEKWGKTYGNLRSVTRASRMVIVDVPDEEAQDLIDELDRIGMNHEEER